MSLSKMENNINMKTENTSNESELQIIQLSKRFLKVSFLMLSGYALGYMGFSCSWLLIGGFAWTLRYKYFVKQKEKVDLLRSISSNEKLAINCAVKDLPSWVYFPDTERAEWLNKILKQMWPFIDEYVKTLIKESIEPNITSSLPDFLKSFRFEKVDLGSIPVRIGSVKCYDENTARDEIILDIEIIYAGNSDIQMRVKGMKAGIKDFQLYGIIRVELRPLIKDIPMVGCVSFYFLNSPTIEFNLTNLADILDIPGLSEYLRRAIKEQLDALMVLPNKYVFPLINELSMKSIKFLPPIGAVRIEVIEARNLKKSDVGVLGLGKSDPYVRILIGSQEFRSEVIYNTVNPKWNYICEAVIHHFHGQSIEIEVMDEDQGSKDDFLGKTSLSLSHISGDGMTEAWLTLRDTKKGAIHVRTTWFELTDCVQQLNESVEESKQIKDKYESIIPTNVCNNRTYGSVAAILVYLDGAKNLPVISKTTGEPDPYCIVSIGSQKRHSTVKSGASCPNWEETFTFMIDDFNENQEIVFELLDSKTNRHLGTAKLKLQNVISCEGMTFTQPLPIKGRATDCELNSNIVVKILRQQKVIQKLKLLVEEPSVEESEETSNIPTLEDIIKSTVQPIIDTSGLDRDIIEESQKDRTHNHIIKTNGSKMAETNGEVDENESKDYPRIQMSFKKTEENKITVILHKAENLPKIGGKIPDPYVKIYKMPDKPSRTLRDDRLKSGTKRNTCNPVFDENFEIQSDFQTTNSLEVVVYSRNGSSNLFKKKSKILGLASIALDALTHSNAITDWYDLEQTDD